MPYGAYDTARNMRLLRLEAFGLFASLIAVSVVDALSESNFDPTYWKSVDSVFSWELEMGTITSKELILLTISQRF